MKTTIVLVSTNRGVFFQTRNLINALKSKGALYLEQQGASCVAMARNFALTSACEALDEAPNADMVLMLDDDMDAPPRVAEVVVSIARTTSRPASAVYTTAEGVLAHSVYDQPFVAPGSWLSGLGFLAVPRGALLSLRAQAPVYSAGKRQKVHAFTEAKMIDGQWSSEDYTLCRRLGGVVLAPVAVGHLKIQSLHPNALQLETVAKRYDEALGPKEVQHEKH